MEPFNSKIKRVLTICIAEHPTQFRMLRVGDIFCFDNSTGCPLVNVYRKSGVASYIEITGIGGTMSINQYGIGRTTDIYPVMFVNGYATLELQ